MTAGMPESQFCEVCGHENLTTDDRCNSCGTLMSSEYSTESSTEGRPIQWRWVGLFLGVMAFALAVVTFVPVVNQLFMYIAFPKWKEYLQAFSPPAMVLPHGMVSVVPLMLLYVVGGLLMGFIANRAIYREMALGSIASVMVMWLIWFVRSGFEIKVLALPVVAIGDAVSIHLPPVMFLLTINIACMLLAAGSCRVAVMLAEKLVGRTNCYTCGKSYSIKPKRPLACPGCGTAQLARGMSFAWAAPTVVVTLLLFFLTVSFLGPKAKFYYRCEFTKLSDVCRGGLERYYEKRDSMYLWRSDKDDNTQPGVIMDPYRYVGLLVPLFFLGPFVISWRCRRSRFKTAGVTILTNWIGATMVAMIGLGFAQFEGVFMLSLRLHMVAGMVWCVTGAIGLFIGSKLAPNMELDLDPDMMD